MTELLTSIMQSGWMKALGWTFIHSIWQIALAGFLLFILLRFVPRRRAHVRYTISTMALWLIVVMALSTFIVMLPEPKPASSLTGNIIFVATASEPAGFFTRWVDWLEVRMPMMLTVWLGGVTILMLRLALSLGWIRHVQSAAVPEHDLQQQLDDIIRRLYLKVKAGAATSRWMQSPVTIGHIKPMILFPVGLVNRLTPQEVEAVLTHELAHIVRRDYLSNLVQSFIETLFYYHPVTWWISRIVRTERENRADDLAVSWCGNHLEYAKALIAVQEMSLESGPSLAIGFASRKNAMLARIQRILNLPNKNHNQMEKTVLLSLCSLCFLAFTLTSQNPADPRADATPAAVMWPVDAAETADTIPAKGIYRIHKKTDDQDISIEVEDGEIRQLKVDGQEVAPSEYEAYSPLVDALFGGLHVAGGLHVTPALPDMNLDFAYMMPPMPALPSLPDMPDMNLDFNFDYNLDHDLFQMPDMPDIPDMDFGYLFNNDLYLKGAGNGVLLWSDDNEDGVKSFGINRDKLSIFGDSLPDGARSKMILYINGDTIVHYIPNGGITGFNLGPYLQNKELREQWREQWQDHTKAWRENAAQWREEWQERAKEWREQNKENAEQWRERGEEWRRDAERLHENQQELRERLREQGEERRARQQELRNQIREIQIQNENHNEREIRRDVERHIEEAPHPLIREFRSERISLSEQMVNDGLIRRGEEAKVVLTPDKLKINGKKMPDGVHQKYLKMYERQQGIELSGSSKVEFTTKSRQGT